MSCKPKAATGGAVFAATSDPCERLRIVEDALFALASGQKRVEVRQGENWVRFTDGSVAFLERERARLSALCNRRTAITIGRSKC